MLAEELVPFSALIPELDSMMVGHAHYPAFDPDRPRLPSSLSHNIVTRLLRDQLGFDDKLVMTDDLDMGAVLNEVGFEATVQEAVKAGNDLCMICHRLDMVEEAKTHLAALPGHTLETALRRVADAKARLCPPARFDLDEFEAVNRGIWELRVATLGEERAAVRSPEDGKRSPVELY
jgi:beta-N-acetylhexosaminidase